VRPTTGRDSHPEVAEISDLSEGLLPHDRGAEVRLHIAGCALCADILTSLEEIRGLLGTLPGPPQMPADIAGRIDAALAAEALLDSTRPDVPRETSPPGPGRVPRETSTAPAGHPNAATGPTSDGPSGKRRRRRWLLAAASVAGVLVLGGVVYQAGSGSNPSDTDSSSLKRADTAQSPGGSVADQVRQLLAGSETAVGPSTGATEAPNHADTPMLSQGQGASPSTGYGPTDVPSCVLKATHRSQPPLAVGRDLFRGTAAYLVVLPHPGDNGLVDAFVVNAACTATSPGAVLFQDTYPR
jgi:hypothetical protein